MGNAKEMETLARNIGAYVMRKYVEPSMKDVVRFYAAVVTAPASGGKITVQKPFDTARQLPYVSSVADLAVGDRCVVLVLGSESNAYVFGKGGLVNL